VTDNSPQMTNTAANARQLATDGALSIFGFFDTPGEVVPTYDPGLGVPCPFCLKPLTGAPRKTISLMGPWSGKSYFYRAHLVCYSLASEQEVCEIESSLIDSAPEARAERPAATAATETTTQPSVSTGGTTETASSSAAASSVEGGS
jgi:hypothetical protein